MIVKNTGARKGYLVVDPEGRLVGWRRLIAEAKRLDKEFVQDPEGVLKKIVEEVTLFSASDDKK